MSGVKILPAIRRQTIHMENATSIIMGNCKKTQKKGTKHRWNIYIIRLLELLLLLLMTENYTDCKELPVLLHTERSGSIGFVKSKVAKEKVNWVLKSNRKTSWMQIMKHHYIKFKCASLQLLFDKYRSTGAFINMCLEMMQTEPVVLNRWSLGTCISTST